MKYYAKILVALLLSVLIPCITVFTVTNFITLDQYRESVSVSQLDRLRAIDSTNQLILDNLEQGALRFSLDPAIQSLAGLTTLPALDPNRYLSGMTRAMDMLGDFVSTNKLFDSVYLYIDGGDYLISSRDSVVTLERAADLGWMDKYKELAENRRANRMMPAHAITTGYAASGGFTSYGRRCLTYVYPITPYISNFHGALVFNIFEERLLEMYTERTSSSSIAMFDENGNWLTGTRNTDYAALLGRENWERIFNDEAAASGYFFSSIDKSNYQCTYFRSSDGHYVLLSMEDMGVLMQRATFFQLVFVVFLLLFVPFVALLILLVSRRLYSPIGSLVRELTANGRLELSGGEKDEWSAISRAVNELMREDRRLFSDREREKLRDATFLRILAGEDEEGDEDAKVILPYRRSLCIIAEMDATASQISEDENYDSRLRLLMWLIEDELSQEGLHATAMRYEGSQVAVILSADETVQALGQVLLSRLTVIRSEAEAAMGHTITLAVGSLKEEPANVRLSFSQAKNALQYRFMKGLQSILFYDEIYAAIEHYNADERLKYIQHCLNCSKKDAVIQGIRELVGDIKMKGNVSYTYTSQILNQLVTALAQYAVENRIHLEELLGDSTIIYQRLWQNRTLDEACEWFCSMAAIVMDYRNVSAGGRSEYVKHITEYVRENYDRDITIDSIAEHIGISYSYLRKLYKEATGQNLADYINRLRIEKAKQLLRETNYTVKEIAALCGYNHERSFSRTFAQSEGMSPGRYKELGRSAEQ